MEAPRRRPAPVIRVFVLVAAIACLGLTMCHSENKATTPPANAQPRTAQPTQPAPPPANPPPTYFPATKSAGPIR